MSPFHCANVEQPPATVWVTSAALQLFTHNSFLGEVIGLSRRKRHFLFFRLWICLKFGEEPQCLGAHVCEWNAQVDAHKRISADWAGFHVTDMAWPTYARDIMGVKFSYLCLPVYPDSALNPDGVVSMLTPTICCFFFYWSAFPQNAADRRNTNICHLI